MNDQLIPKDKDYNNVVFGEKQKEYKPLPAHKVRGDSMGRVTVTYALTMWQRLKLLFKGELYLTIFTFNNPLPPLLCTVNNHINSHYLPLDVVSIEHEGRDILTRILIGQWVRTKAGGMQVVGFVKYDKLFCQTNEGVNHVVRKKDCIYYLTDIFKNEIHSNAAKYN